jgi:hypothetical protein
MGFGSFMVILVVVFGALHGIEVFFAHRERMKVLTVGEKTAQAMLNAAPEERSALAQELLEAYDESGQIDASEFNRRLKEAQKGGK